MRAYTLYYFVPYPESEKYMDDDMLRENEYVLCTEEGFVFVDKDVVDNRNGL